VNRRLIASLAVGLVALAGCSTSAPSQGPAQQPATTSSAPAPAAPAVESATPAQPGVAPADFTLSRLGISSSLIPVGVAADGSMAVPSVHTPKQAGWFEPGPEPGQKGPAVIVGHIDGDHIPGVFYKLREARVGDAITVSLKDGKKLGFVVYKTESVSKDGFPADRVFGYTADSELRLITCGGEFDSAARSYKNNTVVYAKAA
jgi:flagellar basal body L-ring protein FlgH